MINATREDKPESFRPPPGIVAVDIDTASGRLATDDCRRASNATVRTEYFARGTEPIDLCPIHRANILRALVVPSAPPPAAMSPRSVPAAESPAAAVADARRQDSPRPADQPEKKKRGFWSRLFGRNVDRSDTHERK
jgi:hypothetical protein